MVTFQNRCRDVLSHQTQMDDVNCRAQALLDANPDARISHAITQLSTKYQAVVTASKVISNWMVVTASKVISNWMVVTASKVICNWMVVTASKVISNWVVVTASKVISRVVYRLDDTIRYVSRYI